MVFVGQGDWASPLYLDARLCYSGEDALLVLSGGGRGGDDVMFQTLSRGSGVSSGSSHLSH